MEKQFPEFSAVLFDMDGVIFDTEKVVVACWLLPDVYENGATPA